MQTGDFTLTAGLAGLGGAMLATLTDVASPTQFNYTASVMIIAIVIIGGVGNPSARSSARPSWCCSCRFSST